jgi:4-amino-4-deoxy-L-arabinose transferase-like glycosyltransferase
MAEPISPVPVCQPARTGRWRHALGRLASLPLILEIALAVRVIAADAVEWYVRRGGTDRLCVFPDTRIYWELARTIRAGAPYEIVEWGDIPHFALRTPGYPLVLAASHAVFGERPLAVRLVQAALGTLSVFLVYCLTRQLVTPGRTATAPGPDRVTVAAALTPPAPPRRWTTPLVAAALAAVNPYYVLMSSLILSEAAFVPLMLASLLGPAILWPAHWTGAGASSRGPDTPPAIDGVGPIMGWRAVLVALVTGTAAGGAILVRPSCALFVPMVLAAWVAASLRDRRTLAATARRAVFYALGVVLIMSPWWIRNERIYGRFVPTALWLGPSLYDGLNPGATGASDMSFLSDPDIWPLDEQDQDAELARRAVDFARNQPLQALSLAVIKLGRYWSPWPNAEVFHSPALGIASTVLELPLFVLMAMGLCFRRRDPRAWVLLAGPVLYFSAVHMVFASSMRYRIPGEMPALGLAAMSWMRLATNAGEPSSSLKVKTRIEPSSCRSQGFPANRDQGTESPPTSN